MQHARDQHLLIAGGGDNCVRLLPPLNLTLDEAREAIEQAGSAPARPPAPRPRPPREPAVRHFLDLWRLEAADLRAILDDAQRPQGRARTAGPRAASTPTRRPRTAPWR